MSGNYAPGGITDVNGKHFVNGPGCGFGYHAGTLYPWSRFDSEAAATAAAELCKQAFKAGKEQARCEIREALGITAG